MSFIFSSIHFQPTFCSHETAGEHLALSADSPAVSQQFSEEVGHLGMTQQFFSEADDQSCTPSLDMIQTSSPVLSAPLPDEDDLNLRYEPITNFVTFVKHWCALSYLRIELH